MIAADPTAFAEARLAEDGAEARRNIGAGLHSGDPDRKFGPSYPDYQTYNDADTDAADAFIVRFGPARMIREVEAGRRILKRHSRAEGMAAVCCTWCSDDSDTASLNMPWPCPDVLDLLYRWAGHPDYDQKWKLDS